MTDTPPETPADRRVVAYEVNIDGWPATVRYDAGSGQWMVESIAVNVGSQAVYGNPNPGFQPDPAQDPSSWRWDDPAVAQDAAETMLRAFVAALADVRSVRPVLPEPPAA